MKNIGVRSFIVGLCLMGLGSWSPSLKAQIADRVYKTDYHIDPEKARELSVELDNISFFKDNEYTGKFTKGYSLPGLWVQGKAVYYPLRNIKLEAGVHMLIYHGANKYPSMAYQDIAYWKEGRPIPKRGTCVALFPGADGSLGSCEHRAGKYLRRFQP